MVVRPITSEEKNHASKIQSIAFVFSSDFNAPASSDENEDDKYKTCRAAFDESGKMCSCLELLPFEVRFDGKTVPMSGIGGVATLPEELGKKYAQTLMKYCLDEMYERGDIFSYLYPFSHSYYRKFGYELNMRLNSYSIALDAFKQFKENGVLKLYMAGDATEVIKNVYYEFIADKNLAVVRNDNGWNRFFDKDPYKDNVYIYVAYDSHKQARGYIRYSVIKKQNEKCEMVVNELIWLDFKALSDIFAFISGHQPQYKSVKWRAPEFLDLSILFNEPYSVERDISTSGMNRIVNVKKCLELMKAPDVSGSIVIDVCDDTIERNRGKHNIAWENGVVKVTDTHKDADMACDIQSLSQMATGFATPTQLLSLGKIKQYGKHDIANDLFIKKDLYINDHF